MGNFFENAWTSIVTFFSELGKDADDVLLGLLKIVGILVAAYVSVRLIRRAVRRILRVRIHNRPTSVLAGKSDTIESVVGSVTKFVIYFLAVTAILGILGLGTTVTSLLATAGIGGVAVAFGAQSFVKDVVSGMFMLFENQYAVGEYIEIGTEKGTVEAITLRTTRIRRFTGETTTIPNGNITQVTNYSRGDHLAVIDMMVAHDTDLERASQIMQNTGLEYMKRHDNILEEPHVLGVEHMGRAAVTLRMIVRVKPLTHWETERALRRAVKEAFDANGIRIPQAPWIASGEA